VPVVSDIPANRAWIEDGVGGVLVAIDAAAVADGIERAAALDRAAVAAVNRRVVRERADRARNLGALEEQLVALAAGAPA
jgi:glycosyltransferase involved in cell wall biosynthesis